MTVVRPQLDGVELQQVQTLTIDGDEVLVGHGVPALEGDFLQRLGRRASRVAVQGVLTGPEARASLETLREKFRAATPVPFVADLTAATRVDQVLIVDLGARELAGKPERFEVALTLREFIPPPPPETVPPPPPPPPPPPETDTGVLEVEVVVDGQPTFDHSGTTVTLEGTQDDQTPLTRQLGTRTDNVWREDPTPPGQYTVRAVTAGEPAMTGSAPARVSGGQTTRVQIRLSPAQTSRVATTFIVHFRFDRAFVEPCMRAVLKQVMDHAAAHPSQKLLIVGHTDLTGSGAYNQSLSERRARTVFAALTVGRDRAGAIAAWNEIRQSRPAGQLPSVRDNWDLREAQHMLQDLGFYPGGVDGLDGPLTRDAIQAYRCHKGLPPGTTMDDQVWSALIEDYLIQDNFALAEDRFLPNCAPEILKWLGGGEEDPVLNTTRAWRPNRRTELMFVELSQLPCQVPQPDTFNLPAPGSVNAAWCVGPAAGNDHCCFLTPADPNRQNVSRDPNALTRQPAEPGTFTLEGSIRREQADGSRRPAANQRFVLIAPTGQFKRDEQANGDPVAAQTDAQGNFRFDDMPAGVYDLEVVTTPNTPLLVRLADQPNARVTGNRVCAVVHAPATGGANPRIDVLIVNAPLLREIRLPVVAHVLTALDSRTNDVRQCPNARGVATPQRCTHTDAEIRGFFDGANRIWQQGRIRFEPVEIVRAAYTHPIADPAVRGSCPMDDNEQLFVMGRCNTSDVINVYFVGAFDGAGEAGGAISPETAGPVGLQPGCAVADQLQTNFGGVLIDIVLDAAQSEQVLAHELGHYLNLDHVEDTPANAGRLMLAASGLTASNTQLSADEVTRARTSQAARDDCLPLSLRVTGATQLGGSLSDRFILVQNPASTVTIDAEIRPDLLTTGSLVMTGGAAGASPTQRTVSGAATGEFEIVATYTPNSGGTPKVKRVRVLVVTLTLQVLSGGAVLQPATPGGTTFMVRRDATANAAVTVRAVVTPSPFCVPTTFITWQGGAESADPLRRSVPIGATGSTTVTGTLAGVARAVTVSVFEVMVSLNSPPFTTALTQVNIEGLLNSSLTSLDLTDLFDTQPNSLFRIRAVIPDVPAATTSLNATVVSTGPGNTAIETVTIALDRPPAGGDLFLSLPALAVPAAIPRADIRLRAPADMATVRTQAGGRLRVTIATPTPLGQAGVIEVTARGRVVYVAAQAFTGSSTTVADIRRHLTRANRVWAQAGVEIKERSAVDGLTAPAGLNDLDHNSPFNGRLTAEERQLLNITPGGPGRSPTASDLNVYYLRSIGGPASGTAFTRESFSAMTDPGQSAIALEGPAISDVAPAHEIGHMLLIAWPGEEHQDQQSPPVDWPDSNVMHPVDTGNGTDLDQTQVVNILVSTRVRSNPFIIFEP
jgi:outer membrane protein OmpA-like peptidoglycan-associated protein